MHAEDSRNPHLRAVKALERAGFAVARQGKHIVMTDDRMILQRTTVALPADLLGAVDRLIRSGSVANRNQFITLAIETELQRCERAAIDAEFALMAADPDYRAEAAQIAFDLD